MAEVASAPETVLKLGHSPDADDAFMFYALAAGRLDTGDLRFEHILKDIETLNTWALAGRLEVTAISVHAYPHVAERYVLTSCGASVGERYGPVLVAREAVLPADLRGKRIAVPGRLTTAALALRLFLPDFEAVHLPFDRVTEAVWNGEAEAGLLIHEGQLTHESEGLHLVADLGEWWFGETGLPLPLGVNAVRRDLGDRIPRISRFLRESIEYGLAHRDEALTYALRFARGLDRGLADRFVGMYVNERTVDIGEDGRRAVDLLLHRGGERGLVPAVKAIEWC